MVRSDDDNVAGHTQISAFQVFSPDNCQLKGTGATQCLQGSGILEMDFRVETWIDFPLHRLALYMKLKLIRLQAQRKKE